MKNYLDEFIFPQTMKYQAKGLRVRVMVRVGVWVRVSFIFPQTMKYQAHWGGMPTTHTVTRHWSWQVPHGEHRVRARVYDNHDHDYDYDNHDLGSTGSGLGFGVRARVRV